MLFNVVVRITCMGEIGFLLWIFRPYKCKTGKDFLGFCVYMWYGKYHIELKCNLLVH